MVLHQKKHLEGGDMGDMPDGDTLADSVDELDRVVFNDESNGTEASN